MEEGQGRGQGREGYAGVAALPWAQPGPWHRMHSAAAAAAAAAAEATTTTSNRLEKVRLRYRDGLRVAAAVAGFNPGSAAGAVARRTRPVAFAVAGARAGAGGRLSLGPH